MRDIEESILLCRIGESTGIPRMETAWLSSAMNRLADDEAQGGQEKGYEVGGMREEAVERWTRNDGDG